MYYAKFDSVYSNDEKEKVYNYRSIIDTENNKYKRHNLERDNYKTKKWNCCCL